MLILSLLQDSNRPGWFKIAGYPIDLAMPVLMHMINA